LVTALASMCPSAFQGCNKASSTPIPSIDTRPGVVTLLRRSK
jgi:hypothetical protein